MMTAHYKITATKTTCDGQRITIETLCEDLKALSRWLKIYHNMGNLKISVGLA